MTLSRARYSSNALSVLAGTSTPESALINRTEEDLAQDPVQEAASKESASTKEDNILSINYFPLTPDTILTILFARLLGLCVVLPSKNRVRYSSASIK